MKSNTSSLALRPLAAAVQGAIAALAMLSLAPAARADDDVAALTNPTSSIELGLTDTQHASPQFGQYNGLYDSGVTLLGNVDLKGGDSYGEKAGISRWSLTGRDLGTTSRSLGATYGKQGEWNLGLSYDQLRHEITNSFQTPLVGDMGGNTFTMPTGFGIVSKARGAPGTQQLTPAQQAFFQTKDVYSERGTTRFTAEHALGREWDIRFHWTHIKQSGAKLIGSGSDAQTTSAAFLAAGYAPGNEAVQLLMNPTDAQTDNFDLSMNWSGHKGFFTGSFFASNYRDANSALYFSNPYTSTSAKNGTVLTGAFPVDLLSTPPSNRDAQVNLSGGYNLSEATQLVGGVSYGRNTQDMAYAWEPAEMQKGVIPVTSLNGLVVNTHADARVTNHTTRDLTLSAGLVYNKRDNQTPSYAYPFYTLGGDAASPVNVPLSYSRTNTDVAADYRISQRQNLHVALQNEKIRRWCDNGAAVALGESLAAAVTGYYTNVACVQVPDQSETKLVARYRAKVSDRLHVNAGYDFADRKSTVNPSFYNPMQSFSEGFENYGYLAYFQASRRENKARAGMNFAPNDRVNFGLNGYVTNDQYTDSPLGVQNGHSANVNLDSNFQVSEHSALSAYLSWQWRTRDLLSAAGRNAVSTTGLTDWTNSLRDQSTTVGLTASRDGLLGGKLKLAADVSYSIDTTSYNTGAGAGFTCNTGGTSGYNCGAVPDIRNEISRVKLTGNYQLDKKSSVSFGYLYERLNSNDYVYNFYQYGYTSTSVMPANLTNPSYTQNVVFVAYRYAFQ